MDNFHWGDPGAKKFQNYFVFLEITTSLIKIIQSLSIIFEMISFHEGNILFF